MSPRMFRCPRIIPTITITVGRRYEPTTDQLMVGGGSLKRHSREPNKTARNVPICLQEANRSSFPIDPNSRNQSGGLNHALVHSWRCRVPGNLAGRREF